MLLLLGMGSMLGNVTAIITPLRDFKVVSNISNELLNGKIHILILMEKVTIIVLVAISLCWWLKSQ